MTLDTLSDRQGGVGTWLDLLGQFDITGADIHGEADAIINQLGDGTSLSQIWDEIRDVLAAWNDDRNALINLLSYDTVNVADQVPQSISAESLEPATEYGVPRGVRADPSMLVGFDFEDYDIATRFTWKFLRSADQGQVRNVVNRIMEADVKCLTGTVLNRLFDPTEGLSPENHRVFPLWTGQDGFAPLRYLGTEFDSSHNHYLVSGANVVDSADLEALIKKLTEHGYGRQQGSQILILCNEIELEKIVTFRAGEESRSGGPKALYDFIPSATAPPYLTSKSIVGATPPGELNGLPIAGQYGPAWVLSHELIPAGYLASAASAGANRPSNPIAFREHVNPSYRGLRPIPGVGPHPIQESFFVRSFGVGARHRGAACVMAIGTGVDADYEPPTIET
jgi:hypothetical protein